MSWYAVDAIDGAIDASREFLFPFSLGRWARLALITFFVGGGGGVGVNQLSSVQNAGQVPPGAGPDVPPDLSAFIDSIDWGVVLAALAVVLLIGLVLSFISSTFEFVFVDVIAADRVRIVDPFSRHAGNGLRLLGFNLVLTLVTFAPIAAVLYLSYVAGGPPGFNGFDALGTGALVAFVAFALVWFVLSGFVGGLTRTLVVPVMVATGTGVLGGWGRLWPRLRTEWKQTLMYLLLRFFVGIGVGLVGGLLSLFGLVVVGIVALVVAIAAAAVTHGGDPTLGLGVGALAGVAVGFLLFFVFVVLPVGILTNTYLRTYELASLAGFDDAFDLLGPYHDAMDDGSDDSGGSDGSGGSGAAPGTGTGSDDDGPDGANDVNGGSDDGFGGFVPADDSDDSDDRRRTDGGSRATPGPRRTRPTHRMGLGFGPSAR